MSYRQKSLDADTGTYTHTHIHTYTRTDNTAYRVASSSWMQLKIRTMKPLKFLLGLIREMSEVQTGRFCYLPGDNFDKVTVSESVKKRLV